MGWQCFSQYSYLTQPFEANVTPQLFAYRSLRLNFLTDNSSGRMTQNNMHTMV